MFTKHKYVIIYSLVFMMYGSTIGAMGPIIIFFSKDTGKDETDFSFIFFFRTAGFIAGGFLSKELVKYYQYHTIFKAGIAATGCALIFSSLSLTFVNLALWMFIVAMGCCIMSVMASLCIFAIFVGDHPEFWIQVNSLVFSIGGLVGPVIVIYFQSYGMMVIGVLALVTLIPFYFIKSPEAGQNIHQIH